MLRKGTFQERPISVPPASPFDVCVQMDKQIKVDSAFRFMLKTTKMKFALDVVIQNWLLFVKDVSKVPFPATSQM